MWQIRWQIYPSHKMAILDLYCESSYVRAQMWQIRWQIYFLPEMAILDSYFESSDVADQVADIPPLEMAIFHSYL